MPPDISWALIEGGGDLCACFENYTGRNDFQTLLDTYIFPNAFQTFPEYAHADLKKRENEVHYRNVQSVSRL